MPLDPQLGLPSHFREMVDDTFRAAIQQQVSQFGEFGSYAPGWTSDQYVFTERAPLTLREVTGQRGGKRQAGEFTAGKRSGFKREFEGGIDFDRKDKARLLQANLPTSEVQQDLLAAFQRSIDDCYVQAAAALAYGGPKPYITQQALPAHMTIPVNFQKRGSDALTSNTGFTIYKLQEAITRMKQLNVDLGQDQLILAISPEMEQSWLIYAAAAKTELFATLVAPWLNDKSKPVMGCRCIVTNRLTQVSTGIDEALVFAKRAFLVSPPSHEIHMDTLVEDRHKTAITFYGELGVVRQHDELVKRILCDRAGDMLA